jgi:hypothetical protein
MLAAGCVVMLQSDVIRDEHLSKFMSEVCRKYFDAEESDTFILSGDGAEREIGRHQ